MPRHDDLIRYVSNTAATAAADAESVEQGPYRVWQCAMCRGWHAAAWTQHGRDPEVYGSHVNAGAGADEAAEGRKEGGT